MDRRLVLSGAAAFAALLLADGCASDPEAAPVARPGQPLRWRTLQGGFLTPALPPLGIPAAGGTGMFTRWIAPGALALQGNDLLVADTATQRLWRAELNGQLVSGVAGAPVGPDSALLLGPDLSAWVLDTASAQVLRFARDGRLLQTWRLGITRAAPAAMALADGGATLLLADGLSATWTEQRAGVPRSIAPELEGGARVSGVDALASAPAGGVFVLDRLAGAVHEVSREGRVQRTLGRGELLQPVAIAADRIGRVYVHDAQDHSIKRLQAGKPTLRWSAAELGVQRIGGIAADGWFLAVSDRLAGLVQVYSFAHDSAP